MAILGHAKKGVSGIKHFYWAQPICLPYTIYEKTQFIGKASDDLAGGNFDGALIAVFRNHIFKEVD